MDARITKFCSILKNTITAVLGILTIYFTFFSWDDIGVSCTSLKVAVLLAIFAICFIAALLIYIFTFSESVWSRGSGSIAVKTGDLLGNAFKKSSWFSSPKQGLYVIPVNTHFDTIVEDETVANPLVTKKTIHGKWLKRYESEFNKTPDEIQNAIYQYLDARNVHYDPVTRTKGSQRLYEAGTCAIIQGTEGRNFLLIALSEFNNNNNAHATKDAVIDCTHKLLTFINQSCQGKKCYLPLMGTGQSRANLSHKESLHVLLSTMDLYNDEIISPLEIIIYTKDKNKVSIFDK